MPKKHPTQKTLVIKNMVCDRCVRVVREELQNIGIRVRAVRLGEADIETRQAPSTAQIRKALQESGFDLVDNRKARIIEQVKHAVIQLVRTSAGDSEIRRFPRHIEKKIGLDYAYVSSLFSSIENITIERFIMYQKIERVKELLKYDELTLSEMAYELGYSSVAHLSNQFKKITGMSCRTFKQLREAHRNSLDRVSS